MVDGKNCLKINIYNHLRQDAATGSPLRPGGGWLSVSATAPADRGSRFVHERLEMRPAADGLAFKSGNVIGDNFKQRLDRSYPLVEAPPRAPA